MRIFNRFYVYVFCSGVLLSLFIGGLNLLHSELRANYTILGQGVYGSNVLEFHWNKIFEYVLRTVSTSNKQGLRDVRLYVPERAKKNLMEDIPASVKKWQPAFMIYPDNTMHRIKVKHRGDNPLNWAYEKKSWRIKTKKKQLIHRTRSFNYVVPQEGNLLDNYLAYYIGNRVGVVSPRANMVELFINDRSHGVYTEVEHLDESFLRNSWKMPVNLYKGEQYNAELQMMIQDDLFNNPALWSKRAVFNQLESTDNSDLSHFISLIRKAETSEKALKELKQVARYKEWSLFAAYMTMIQSWSNDTHHNMRLISDLWRGNVDPVVHDTISYYGYFSPSSSQPVFDSGYHALWAIYNKSSDFLIQKYRILYDLLQNSIISQSAEHIENEILPELRESRLRDRFMHQLITANTQDNKLIFMAGMEEAWSDLLSGMRYVEQSLLRGLQNNPNIWWHSEEKMIMFVIDGITPAGDITLELSEDSPTPKMIVWDKDGNGKISTTDLRIPFKVKNREITLDAIWTANRVILNQLHLGDMFQPGVFHVVPTTFKLISDVTVLLSSMKAVNAITSTPFDIPKNTGKTGNTPSFFNRPVIEQKTSSQVWSDVVTISGNLIVTEPVLVEAGTTIKMASKSSLIFKNRVHMKGTIENPIQVVPDTTGTYWGTVAIHGEKTAGSIISNVKMKHGSGAVFPNVRYIAMVSVHETENITFNHVSLQKNYIYDDMIHIIYSKNVNLNHLVLEEARSDGLDVDLSTVIIRGGRIVRAGNDAVDLMTSQVLIEEVELMGSGDKGISVGEGTEAVVFNSYLVENKIGVQSKDASRVFIINSDLINNRQQADSFSKNWRYAKGGTIVFEKSFISNSPDKITAAKKSYIQFFDSTIESLENLSKKRINIDDASTIGNSKTAVIPYFQPDTQQVLDKWGINGFIKNRGVMRE